MNNKICPTCGGALIQKNRWQLFLSGMIFLIIATGVMVWNLNFWPLSFFLVTISFYLVAWATRGKGLWCRQCKAAPGLIKR